MIASVPLLPTTVIGSYSVPDWLDRLKTDYYRNRISAAQLRSIHDVCIKAALKDQEVAGIDIVSDGELRRDNDIDYLLSRLPGVQIAPNTKDVAYDYFEAYVDGPLPEETTPGLGLAEDYAFTVRHTDRPVKFSFTGPFSLSRRIRNECYRDSADLVRAIARMLNAEAQALVAAGATTLQIDEPYLAGYPEQAGLAVEAVNIVTAGVDAHWGLHVCYGNRYARPSWRGITTSCGRPSQGRDRPVGAGVRPQGLRGPRPHRPQRLGTRDRARVVDVKTHQIESTDLIAQRIHRALQLVPAHRMQVNPDCGLRHLPPEIAQAKLHAMVAATRTIRGELGTAVAEPPVSHPTEENQ